MKIYLKFRQAICVSIDSTKLQFTFDIYENVRNCEVGKAILGKNAGEFKTISKWHSEELSRRDRTLEGLKRLLKPSKPRSKEWKAYNEKRIANGEEALNELPAWTNDEFFQGMVVPWSGKSSALIDEIHKARVQEATRDLTPLELIQRAHLCMAARLGKKTKNRTSQLFPTASDYEATWKYLEL